MSTIVRPGRPAQETVHAAGSLSITRPRRRLLWWREVLIFAAAYLAYEALRWVGTGAKPIAVENAKHLFDLENSMGIAFEAGLQRALDGTTILWAMGWIYLAAQTLALIAGVVTCFFLAPRVYRRLRNTLIVMWMLALPVYALLPTAPPRLAGIGLADSVTDATGIALDSPSILMFYNPYAAVPSLHAGFALAVGIGVALATKRWWLRAIGILWGPVVMVSTFATGNHFVLDAVAGIVIAAIGFGIALGLERLALWVRCRRLERSLRPLPVRPQATSRPRSTHASAQQSSTH
jgi:hypothetical protein